MSKLARMMLLVSIASLGFTSDQAMCSDESTAEVEYYQSRIEETIAELRTLAARNRALLNHLSWLSSMEKAAVAQIVDAPNSPTDDVSDMQSEIARRISKLDCQMGESSVYDLGDDPKDASTVLDAPMSKADLDHQSVREMMAQTIDTINKCTEGDSPAELAEADTHPQ